MKEYAPGIPYKGYKGNLLDLPTDAVLTMLLQRHKAKRAGEHIDWRIGNPNGLYSFAVPRGLPEAVGEKRLAIPTEKHAWSYKDFEGTIPSGYGAGEVSKVEESPVVILKNTPDHIILTRGTSKDSPVYSLRRTKNQNWLVSIRKKDEPTVVKFYKKQHFQSVPMEDVPDLIDQGAAVSGKIDGAGALAYLGDNGINVYGIRQNAKGEHPDYTPYIGGLYGANVPDDLKGTLLRTELYGIKDGKPIHPTELTSILNSTIANAVEKKQKRGIKLLMAALAVNKDGIDDYHADVGSVVRKLNNPAIHEWPTYTGVQAKRLVDSIRAGKYVPTKEGVVVYRQGQPTLKSKNIEDFDVIIRDIFPADTKGEPRAGGFMYSYPGSDKIVGRVGTGMDHAMLKDMLANPQKYIGQTARVHSQEKLPSSALRSPGFIALKAD